MTTISFELLRANEQDPAKRDTILSFVCALGVENGYDFITPLQLLDDPSTTEVDEANIMREKMRSVQWIIALTSDADHEIFGFAGLGRGIDEPETCQRLAMMYVRPKFRYFPVITRLLAMCETCTREKKCSMMAYDAPLDIGLLRILVQCGFAVPDARALRLGSSALGRALCHYAHAPLLSFGETPLPPELSATLAARWTPRAAIATAYIQLPRITMADFRARFPEFVDGGTLPLVRCL
jgi:GNAT superfamily N-acetyltransferase